MAVAMTMAVAMAMAMTMAMARGDTIVLVGEGAANCVPSNGATMPPIPPLKELGFPAVNSPKHASGAGRKIAKGTLEVESKEPRKTVKMVMVVVVESSRAAARTEAALSSMPTSATFLLQCNKRNLR